MNTNKTRTCLILGICLFFLFAIFTIAVMKFDVKEVGPNDVSVGFSSLNESFFGKFGQNELFHSRNQNHMRCHTSVVDINIPSLQ